LPIRNDPRQRHRHLVDGKGRLLLDALKPPRISKPDSFGPRRREDRADVRRAGPLRELGRRRVCRPPTALCVEYTRSAGDVVRQHREAGQRHSGTGAGRSAASFVVGTRVDKVVDAIAAHLHGNGFAMVEVKATQSFDASRTDFDSPWINWAAESIRQTTGKAPAVLPNSAAHCPTSVSDALGLPTIWVPHSYPGCSQHAPDEHILLSVTEEAARHHGGPVLGSGRDAARLVERHAGRASATGGKGK